MNGKNRKWAVFTALCLAYMPSSYAQYQLSVFGPELMERYGLTTSQFSAIFTSPMIVAIFLSFAGGIISDRFGPKRVTNIAFLLACAGLYAYGLHEAHDLKVRRLELPLLASDGPERLRLVFAADLHIGPQTGTPFLRRFVEAVNAQAPDLVLLGGDILDDSVQGTTADRDALRQLRSRLGVFAVLGNHDAFGGHERARAFVDSCGIRVLSDELLPLGPRTLLGIDDPDVRAQKGNTDVDVAALVAGRPSAAPVVLLTHRPNLLPDSVGHFALQLSGHTHGGQIGLVEPLLVRAYGTPTGLSRHRSTAGESLLYVTTGVGFSKLPIRLGAPPEIVVIDLVPSAAASRP